MDLLSCEIQNYSWGDHCAIANIMGRGSSELPEAELWVGAHPVAPSRLDSSGESLLDVIDASPESHLGVAVAEKFGGLPFLAKILAAAEPLSIQVHPDQETAAAGFEREEAAGIDRLAPNRTYRDPNHKPEVICAITRFEAKCGFRTPAGSVEILRSINDDRLSHLIELLSKPGLDPENLRLAVGWLFECDIAPMIDALREAKTTGRFAAEVGWAQIMCDQYGNDTGVLIALMLNHVVLEPGDALSLGPGVPHSYLVGTGLELMASSDNVIRGGLTPKFVDVDELMLVMDFRPGEPRVETSTGSVHRFNLPVPDFALTRYTKGPDESLKRSGPELIVVTDGHFVLEANYDSLPIRSGQAAFVSFADGAYSLTGSGLAWRCCVGEI